MMHKDALTPRHQSLTTSDVTTPRVRDVNSVEHQTAMVSKHQSAQDRIAKLQAIPEAGPASKAPKAAPGKPMTLRLTADLRGWCVREAARQSVELGDTVTVQDVVTQAVEAMRASRDG
jgi:hypothetical protein